MWNTAIDRKAAHWKCDPRTGKRKFVCGGKIDPKSSSSVLPGAKMNLNQDCPAEKVDVSITKSNILTRK